MADEVNDEVNEWPRASEWLASGREGGVVVAGVPIVEHAVTPSRYDLAPSAIRARLARLSTYHGERDVDLAGVPVVDRGDALVPPALDAPLTILLGGHNAVTFHALAPELARARWGVLTLDAHHDVRTYAPGQVGNGSPIRALVDAGLRGSDVIQVGIHGFSNSRVHRAYCEEQGITVLGPAASARVPELLAALAARCDRIYVDVDVDVLDRAFAPGCPGARPGGLAPRALLDAVWAAGSHPKVAAVDIVEVDPEADVASITVDVAALCLLTAAAGFAGRRTAAP
ncbi:MAG TPA: arginase family protein [Thermoleophilia bacterium]|nr:arginase family protein [Thermoleophilia bacterium]